MTKQATLDKKTEDELATAVARIFGKEIRIDEKLEDQENPPVIRTVIPFVAKSINDAERTIEFIGSTKAEDRYGDVIEQTGWELGNFIKNPVVPWGHNYHQPPVAQAIEVSLKDGNLCFKGKFPTIAELSSDPDHPSDYALFVDAIYNAYKGGYLRAFSVGFIPLEYDGNWQDGYTFTKCELLEVSCVTVPANPEALTLAFREGVLNDRHKAVMLKQAEKLISSLTEEDKPAINKGMEDVVTELKKLNDKIDAVLAKSQDQPAPAASDEEEAKPADEAAGGTPNEPEPAEETKSLDISDPSFGKTIGELVKSEVRYVLGKVD